MNILNLFRRKQKLGATILVADEKDFELGIFGDYKPKYERKSLKSISIKNQMYNSCTAASATTVKEIDEGVPLSTRFLISMQKKMGYVSGDGFSSLRAPQLVLQKYGCCEESLMPSEVGLLWNEYSTPDFTQEIMDNAAKHKTASFWKINNKYEAFKTIDSGRGFTFGMDWRTSFNAAGGFSFPWILDLLRGYVVGGHAIAGLGYDLKYDTKKMGVVEERKLSWLEELTDKILKFYIKVRYGAPLGWNEFEEVIEAQNSYSINYGKNGRFFIRTSDFEKQAAKFGAFCSMDMPRNIGQWLNEMEGKPVKDIHNPDDVKRADVYLIKDGKKCKFIDVATMYAWGFLDEQIVEDEGMLKDIEEGDALNFWEGPAVRVIKALILRSPHLKSVFGEYFTELFKN